MAAATVTAPRVFFQYAHPGGAVVDPGAVFDARGAMDLYVVSDEAVSVILTVACVPATRVGGPSHLN
eukprot:CAMPEP_0184393196 /NCGR_PEP_ID=MMETSP0007-20130409/33101_1 /TAXON_ID=97485 /ORGANISM="Prymnesium parvum, Strain Texoma1" /LENGTH=66 /DNA_ID=CAMNT_0026744073 /DNA_START=50 /DNA_END=250 /DNA_ORIENTATION=+